MDSTVISVAPGKSRSLHMDEICGHFRHLPDHLPWSLSSLLLFIPFLLSQLWWGHGKRGYRTWRTSFPGLRGHMATRGDWHIPGPWKQGKEPSLPEEDKGTCGKEGLPTGTTAYLSLVKFEAIDLLLLLEALLSLSSCFHRWPHLSLSLTLS